MLNRRFLKGFKLPSTSGLNPADHFAPVTYTGNGSGQDITTGFSPDYVWMKERTGYTAFYSVNSSNSATNVNGVVPLTQITGVWHYTNAAAGVDDFLSNGFSLLNSFDTNDNNVGYVSYSWKCGGEVSVSSSSYITSGSMAANSVSIDGVLQSSYTPSGSPTLYPNKLSVNTVAGQSMITYVNVDYPNDTTIPHGLTQAPEMLWWAKRANDDTKWVWHKDINSANHFLKYNYPDSQIYRTSVMGGVYPTSDLIGVGAHNSSGGSGGSFVLMAVHSVVGYSKVSKYVGTGATGNSITGLGFSPRFVMIKAINRTGEFIVIDSARGQGFSASIEDRIENNRVAANSVTLDSDGFTINTADTDVNSSGYNYLYYAIA